MAHCEFFNIWQYPGPAVSGVDALSQRLRTDRKDVLQKIRSFCNFFADCRLLYAIYVGESEGRLGLEYIGNHLGISDLRDHTEIHFHAEIWEGFSSNLPFHGLVLCGGSQRIIRTRAAIEPHFDDLGWIILHRWRNFLCLARASLRPCCLARFCFERKYAALFFSVVYFVVCHLWSSDTVA